MRRARLGLVLTGIGLVCFVKIVRRTFRESVKVKPCRRVMQVKECCRCPVDTRNRHLRVRISRSLFGAVVRVPQNRSDTHTSTSRSVVHSPKDARESAGHWNNSAIDSRAPRSAVVNSARWPNPVAPARQCRCGRAFIPPQTIGPLAHNSKRSNDLSQSPVASND